MQQLAGNTWPTVNLNINCLQQHTAPQHNLYGSAGLLYGVAATVHLVDGACILQTTAAVTACTGHCCVWCFPWAQAVSKQDSMRVHCQAAHTGTMKELLYLP